MSISYITCRLTPMSVRGCSFQLHDFLAFAFSFCESTHCIQQVSTWSYAPVHQVSIIEVHS